MTATVMQARLRYSVGLLCVALLCSLTFPANAQQPVLPDSPLPIEFRALADPQVLSQENERSVVYEIVIANPSRESFELTSINVAAADGREIAQIAGEPLRAAALSLGSPGATDEQSGSFTIPLPPGARYILYFWLELAEAVPDVIKHDFVFLYGSSRTQTRAAGPELTVREDAITIRPPVSGGYWRVSNGFANRTNHRKFFVVNQDLLIPQRFGADFVKLDRISGDTVRADNSDPSTLQNESFLAYGEPLYAVADGEIVTVVDARIPDNDVGVLPATPMSLEMNAGNHVLLKVGARQYAVYAHLQPGSIRVAEGQRVRQGDVIARIGNSGNTGSAHLHFHISDRPSVNSADGMPFLFDEFEIIDENYRFSAEELPLPVHGRTVENRVPVPGSVIRFPAWAKP